MSFKSDALSSTYQSQNFQSFRNRVITVASGKGGVGTTSIAVNLAAALRNRPDQPTVALVDVNQHGGDLPLYLDLQPNHSFRDIATDLSRLDQAFLIRILTKTESGLQVLASGYDDLSTGSPIRLRGAGLWTCPGPNHEESLRTRLVDFCDLDLNGSSRSSDEANSRVITRVRIPTR